MVELRNSQTEASAFATDVLEAIVSHNTASSIGLLVGRRPTKCVIVAKVVAHSRSKQGEALRSQRSFGQDADTSIDVACGEAALAGT